MRGRLFKIAICMMVVAQLSAQDFIDENTQEVLEISQQLRSIYSALTSSFPHQSDVLFKKLVDICTQPYREEISEKILSDEELKNVITGLRQYRSVGEKLQESYWAEKMLGENSIKLHQYPEYEHFQETIRLEFNMIMAVSPPDHLPRKFIFLGSGPLPLSSISLAQIFEKNNFNGSIHNVDNDPKAIELSKKLELYKNILTFEVADARFCDLTMYDVVFLAALVGSSKEEKLSILKSVASRMKKGALLIIRTVHGMRRVLYQEVNSNELLNIGIKPLLVVHPWNGIINSVIVATNSAQ